MTSRESDAHLKRLLELAEQVERVYRELDLFRETAEREGIACPYGCRECCKTAAFNVEASVVELLPLALHLLRSGEFEFWYGNLRADEEPCVLFEPDPIKKEEGGCLFYEYRPLTCRLFGIGYSEKKTGPVLLTCALFSSKKRELEEKLKKGALILPNVQAYRLRVFSIAPELGELYPINTALKKALELVGMYSLYWKKAG